MKKIVMILIISGCIGSYVDKYDITLEEISSNKFVVFLFGEINKFGNWINTELLNSK